MKKKPFPIGYALMFILPLVIVSLAVIRAKHTGIVYHLADPKRLKEKWSAESYFSIEGTKEFENQISNRVSIATNALVSLTAEQREELIKSIRLVLLAYHTGDYKDYEQFRFPVAKGSFDTNIVSGFLTKLAAIPQYCEGLNTNDTRAVVKKLWETYGTMGKVYCTTCWKDVAISSITVEETTSVNETAIPNVTQTVIANENIGGSVTIHPFFQFTPSEDDILKRFGSITTATVSATIREDPQSSYPVYVQYYWSVEDHLWLPRKMALAYWNEKQLLLF